MLISVGLHCHNFDQAIIEIKPDVSVEISKKYICWFYLSNCIHTCILLFLLVKFPWQSQKWWKKECCRLAKSLSRYTLPITSFTQVHHVSMTFSFLSGKSSISLDNFHKFWPLVLFHHFSIDFESKNSKSFVWINATMMRSWKCVTELCIQVLTVMLIICWHVTYLATRGPIY